jgi:RHS repeat-associated protein
MMWRWDPDTFGSVTPNTNPAGLGVFNYNLRFPGQYYLPESGLFQNYYRDYDPQTGRYIESDPIGLRGGINTYAYTGNNPLLWSDPYGLRPWDWDGIGDTSVCQYYDGQAVATKCAYYTKAAQVCRAQRRDVNLLLRMGIADAWLRGTTTASESAIMDAIRNGLVAADKAARKAGQVGCDGCVKGNAIDLYHDDAFINAGINPFWYGGNQWFQGTSPNFVPYDPEGKPSWDPRKLLH